MNANAVTKGWESAGGPSFRDPTVINARAGDFLFSVDAIGQPGVSWRVDGRWVSGAMLGGVLTSDVVPAVADAGRDQIELFGVGIDGALWWRPLVNPYAEVPWASLGGTILSKPAAIQVGDATYVFGVGLDRALWYQRVTADGASGWLSLGGVVLEDPAVLLDGGRVHVLVMGQDGALWARTLEGSAWSPWMSRGGLLTSSPTTIGGAGGGDVFVVGIDSAVWYRHVTAGRWDEWTSLGGLTTDSIGAARVLSGPAVVVQGLDRAIWIRRMVTGGWRSWERLDGWFLHGSPTIDGYEVFAREPSFNVIRATRVPFP